MVQKLDVEKYGVSVLNDMLHDLEKRTAFEEHELADVYPLFTEPVETGQSSGPAGRWLIFVLVLGGVLLVTGILAWENGFSVSDRTGPAEPSPQGPSGRPVPVSTAPSPVAVRPVTLGWSEMAEARYRTAGFRRLPAAMDGRVTAQARLSADGTQVATGNTQHPAEPAGAVRHDAGSPPGSGREAVSGKVSGMESGMASESDTVPVSETGRRKVATETLSIKTPSREILEKVALDEASELLFRGRRQEAIQRLFQLLARVPDAEKARLVLVGWLIQDRQWTRAGGLLSSVTEDSDLRLREFRARILLNQGRFDEVIPLLEKHQPDISIFPAYHALLAVALQRSGRYAESADIYERLVALEPDRGDWWSGLAIAFDQTGQTGKALAAYEKAMVSPRLPSGMKRFVRNRINILSRWEH